MARLWMRSFASAEARRWLSDRPRHPFGPPLIGLYRTQRWQVAAALSAAVTTTKFIEAAPTLQAEPTPKKRPNSNASRSSGGSAREGLLSEKPPPSHILYIKNFAFFVYRVLTNGGDAPILKRHDLLRVACGIAVGGECERGKQSEYQVHFCHRRRGIIVGQGHHGGVPGTAAEVPRPACFNPEV